MSETASTRVVLVQCTDSKRDGTHPARRLYDESDYYQKQRDYAKAVADEWYIQSAKHGLLRPDREVAAYDLRADQLDDPEAWGEEIAASLSAAVPDHAVVEILGGRAYADPLTPAFERRGMEVLEPLRGQGIGRRKQSLKRMVNDSLEAVP